MFGWNRHCEERSDEAIQGTRAPYVPLDRDDDQVNLLGAIAQLASRRLVYVGEEGEVLLDHAAREFCDVRLVEIIGRLQIDFLNLEEFPVPLDFVANVIAIEFGPGF